MLPSYFTTDTFSISLLTVYFVPVQHESNGLVTASNDVEPTNPIKRVLHFGDFEVTRLFTILFNHLQLLK